MDPQAKDTDDKLSTCNGHKVKTINLHDCFVAAKHSAILSRAAWKSMCNFKSRFRRTHQIVPRISTTEVCGLDIWCIKCDLKTSIVKPTHWVLFRWAANSTILLAFSTPAREAL